MVLPPRCWVSKVALITHHTLFFGCPTRIDRFEITLNDNVYTNHTMTMYVTDHTRSCPFRIGRMHRKWNLHDSNRIRANFQLKPATVNTHIRAYTDLSLGLTFGPDGPSMQLTRIPSERPSMERTVAAFSSSVRGRGNSVEGARPTPPMLAWTSKAPTRNVSVT